MMPGEKNPSRFSHPAIVEQVRDILMSRCQRRAPQDRRALSRFAAARDEDWLVPFAYAAYRAANGTMPSEMGDLFETHEPVERGFIARKVSGTNVPTDVLEALRRADEAGDLVGAVRLFAREAPNEDLRFLMARHDEWRMAIRGLDRSR
jgi:hypothetical protein